MVCFHTLKRGLSCRVLGGAAGDWVYLQVRWRGAHEFNRFESPFLLKSTELWRIPLFKQGSSSLSTRFHMFVHACSFGCNAALNKFRTVQEETDWVSCYVLVLVIR